ncbi:MAG TPA: sulfatase [Sphingobacterium sp.]|nr:sulfatase [Sphingobacterium sp.]
MIRQSFLIIFLISCGYGSIAQRISGSRPNIVFIIADDIGWNDLGCYGHSEIKTPNIDQIANEGVMFTNFYLTTSSCSPSRSSIISGRYPHNTGAAELHTFMPKSVTIFPELLKNSGYYTAQAGKWHMGDAVKRGFDLVQDDNKKNGTGGEDLWVQTIRERPKDKPFFVWFAAADAHRPWGDNVFSGTHSPDRMTPSSYLANAPATRQDLTHYADEIARFDFFIGEVEKELAAQGVLNNTVIIIMSDNGSPFPRAKTRMYDSGIKSFFIVKWNNGISKKGASSSSLLSAVDIAPTLLELAGLRPTNDFQGKSFARILKTPHKPFRKYAFAEHNWHDYEAAERLVATPDHLYILNLRPELSNQGPADAVSSPSHKDLQELHKNNRLTKAQSDIFVNSRPKEELYDKGKDPDQLNNVIGEPGYKRVLNRLRKIMSKWQEQTADDIPANLTKDWFSRETGQSLPGAKERGEMPGGISALENIAKGPF